MGYGERYQPAMRLAGATRAHARGVTDGRIGSDGWFAKSFCFIVRIPIGHNALQIGQSIDPIS